ncbi:MAG: ExbD/TolR family protein [Candidatus Methylomirabilales bacterium]
MLDLSAGQPNARATTNLNITPLVDVMLLLLIFFLLASTFIRPTFRVSLPSAAHSRLDPERKQQITISLTREGRVFVDEVPVPLSELQGRLAKVMARDRDRPVLVQADKRCPFGIFVAAMDAAKGAGAEQLIIETTRTPEEGRDAS